MINDGDDNTSSSVGGEDVKSGNKEKLILVLLSDLYSELVSYIKSTYSEICSHSVMPENTFL